MLLMFRYPFKQEQIEDVLNWSLANDTPLVDEYAYLKDKVGLYSALFFINNSRYTYGLIALYIANILYCYNCLELCWSLLSPPGVFFLQNICFNYGQL